MAISEIQRIGFNFVPIGDPNNPPPEGRGPARPEPVTVAVPPSSTPPHVVMTGFLVEFNNAEGMRNRGDHHFGQLEIRLDARRVSPESVSVTARVGLRDWSHEWDDPFRGEIRFVVVTR